MDQNSILDQTSSPVGEGDMPGTNASRFATASVSAGIAAANALPSRSEMPGPRFPGEDSGRSLAEMAHADLDAALQLLAERAQYITGASGAAIALRRGAHNDMLCRASVGSNAPELGALLSMEYGLSGESVRTRQLLRCDDAARDPRVNHEVCRQLGIASVVVMPILSEQRVLGVFELLSGKPRAFDERDLSALLRLSEMVETAVQHAVAAEVVPPLPAVFIADQPPASVIAPPASPPETVRPATSTAPAPAPPSPLPAKPEPPAPVLKKALFWSAPVSAQAGDQAKENVEAIAVPRVLRNLQKCQACGFPVSQGRAFCVECEEKQWRGQRLPTDKMPQELPSHPVPAAAVEEIAAQPVPTAKSSDLPAGASDDMPESENASLFFSSALQSQSWFAANKYILGALLVVAIVVGAIVWLR